MGGVEVRSNVNVRCADEFHEFFNLDKLVVEDDMAFYPLLLSEPLQGEPVGLTRLLNNMRMSNSEDDVHEVREALHNCGQRGDDILDSLIR